MQIVVEGKINLSYSILFYSASTVMWCVGLLRDTIILDTVCLSEAAKRVTPKDRHILHTLLSKVKQPLPIIVNAIVGDPGSRSKRYGSGSFPFQAGHQQGQAHPPHPPLQGEATTSGDCQRQCWAFRIRIRRIRMFLGTLGSGSISQRYRSGSFPFLIKLLSGLK